MIEENAADAKQSIETRFLISQITDRGRFENLASAVLRKADTLYRSIVQSGTNAKGDTISDPLDALTYATDAVGNRHLIAFEHTTSSRSKLLNKWCGPDGDLRKAASEIATQKLKRPGLKGRIILCCSVDPTSGVVSSVETLATQLGVEVEIWPGTRLAEFLDFDPEGQWIRRHYFGAPQTRLSKSLVAKIGREMMQAHDPTGGAKTLVPRKVLDEIQEFGASPASLLFLSGPSGTGKSALAYAYCSEKLRANFPVCVITHECLATASTLEQAVATALHAYAPDLAKGQGLNALRSAAGEGPVTIWIEDINKAYAPGDVAEKLCRWANSGRSADSAATPAIASPQWQIICPIWPGTIVTARKDIRDEVEAKSIDVTAFSESEAIEAVQIYARQAGRGMFTEVEASTIGLALGHDPLLIALVKDWSQPEASTVMDNYVLHCFERLQVSGNRIASDGRRAIQTMVQWMLETRELEPNVEQALACLPDTSQRDALRDLLRDGKLATAIHFEGRDVIRFRHDRIRDHLLAAQISQSIIDDTADTDIVSDPHYARLVGEALCNPAIKLTHVGLVRELSPLALCHGLVIAADKEISTHNYLLAEALDYFSSTNWSEASDAERWAIHLTLRDYEHSESYRVFATMDDHSFVTDEARARNGDINAAARMCYHLGPSTMSLRRDRILRHARSRGGENWIASVDHLLRDVDASPKLLIGALNLAGETGAVELADAIAARWVKIRSEEGLTTAFLFAAVSCGAGVENFPMEEILAAWAALPKEDPENNFHNPRYNIASFGLAHAMIRRAEDRVVDQLIAAAHSHPDLEGPVQQVLAYADHPRAQRYLVERVAEIDLKIEGTDRTNMLALNLTRFWDGTSIYRRVLSYATRHELRDMWSDRAQNGHVRRRAFQLWAANLTQADVSDLRTQPPSGLEDEAVRARLKRGDRTAKPDLAARISADAGNSFWWWSARAIGTEGLEQCVELAFETRRADFANDPDLAHWRGDDSLHQLLMDRSDDYTLDVVMRHWDHLCNKPYYYVPVLLYLAKPEGLRLVAETVASAEDPAPFFDHIAMRYGIMDTARPGLTRLSQFSAHEPYLDYLSEYAINGLWEAATRLGFLDWRRKHLDPRLASDDRHRVLIDDVVAYRDLDDQFAKVRSFPREARFWCDRRLEAGDSIDTVLTFLETYTSTRRTIQSFEFFAGAILEYGLRADLSRLDQDWAKSLPGFEKLRASTEFAVCHRTLA